MKKSKEPLANALPAIKQAAGDDSLPGVEHLRAFLAAQAKSPVSLVSMGGDEIHPFAPGQLMVAAALLKELGAEGFVSSLALDADGKLVDAKGCQGGRVKGDGGRIEFDRLDERLPFPIPDEAQCVLPLTKKVEEADEKIRQAAQPQKLHFELLSQ